MKLAQRFVALIRGKGRGAGSHGGEPSLLNATGARCVVVVAMSAFCVTFQFQIDPSLVLLQKRGMERCGFLFFFRHESLRDLPASGSFIFGAPRRFANPRVKVSVSSASPSSPPRVAETRKWVPYFLMRFSLICCRVGRRPSNRRLRRNSGAKGSGALRKSLFSVAKLFTFQWLNSLELGTHHKVKTRFIPTPTSHANRL